jgi:hypothetical protein
MIILFHQHRSPVPIQPGVRVVGLAERVTNEFPNRDTRIAVIIANKRGAFPSGNSRSYERSVIYSWAAASDR